MGASGANNLCLFVFDSRRGTEAVNFLCNYGMSEQIRRDYAGGLWAYDPFLLSLRRECRAPIVLERRQLEEREARAEHRHCQPYWQYIDQVGYRDITASIHPFTQDVFLIGGLMGQQHGRKYNGIHCEHVLSEMDQLVGSTASDLVTEGLRCLFPANLSPSVASGALTARETDVVKALKAGNSNKQIAAVLMLSEYTVENHFKRLFKKFSVNNRTALLSKLHSLGLTH